MVSRSPRDVDSAKGVSESGPCGKVLHAVGSWIRICKIRANENARAVALMAILCYGGIVNDPRQSPRLRQPSHRFAEIDDMISAKQSSRQDIKRRLVTPLPTWMMSIMGDKPCADKSSK